MNQRKEFKHSTILNSPAYELFILGLCILAIVIVAEETFFPVTDDILYILQSVDFLICIIFLADFCARLFFAENRMKYLVTWGWLDLISSIPAIELFRIGRLARVLRILKGVRSIQALAKHASVSRSEYALSLATLVTVTTVLTGSVAVLVFESEAVNSNIQHGNDAIWWTVVTMTSVGYGDYVPVTTGGRIVGMILMTVGVAIFATYTGFVASMLLEPGESKQAEELDEIRIELTTIQKQLADISDALNTKSDRSTNESD